jgi:holo-[acyl-carrier protein] synthase
MTAPLLFGVDVLEVERVRAALQRHPGRLERTLADAAEWRHFRPARPALACAAAIALKEAAIKAIGGRPAGTGWHGLTVVGAGPAVPGPAEDLVTEFARAVGVPAGHRVGLRLDHAHDRAAGGQLTAPAAAGPGRAGQARVAGLGWWGERGGEVCAVVTLWAAALSADLEQRQVNLDQGERDRQQDDRGDAADLEPGEQHRPDPDFPAAGELGDEGLPPGQVRLGEVF